MEIVLAAIEQNWEALQYASVKLRNDRDIVLKTAMKDIRALKFASSELKNSLMENGKLRYELC